MDNSSYIHEIKNGLNVIYGVAQILQSEDNIDEIKKYSQLIMNSVNQIKAIDADYDTYQKTGLANVKYQTIYVDQLVKTIVDEYRTIAEKYNVKLTYTSKVCRAYTDATKLRQAVGNILSNAIKYCRDVDGVVSVECKSTGPGAIIIIKDNGIGMTADEQSMIGKPFYRAKNIERPGTGLGISIVKRFAKLLQWDLSIHSIIGVGTTVSITLHHIMG